VRQAPGARLPVQVQMNDNAAQFRKEVSVRLTLRASIIEKSCVRLFRHRQTFLRRNRPLPFPAFLLLCLRLHGQAGKPPFLNLPRRLLREHFSACGAGALHPPFCRQSKWQKLPWMLAVSKMAGAKPEG
jgi:hypothetical protein